MWREKLMNRFLVIILTFYMFALAGCCPDMRTGDHACTEYELRKNCSFHTTSHCFSTLSDKEFKKCSKERKMLLEWEKYVDEKCGHKCPEWRGAQHD